MFKKRRELNRLFSIVISILALVAVNLEFALADEEEELDPVFTDSKGKTYHVWTSKRDYGLPKGVELYVPDDLPDPDSTSLKAGQVVKAILKNPFGYRFGIVSGIGINHFSSDTFRVETGQSGELWAGEIQAVNPPFNGDVGAELPTPVDNVTASLNMGAEFRPFKDRKLNVFGNIVFHPLRLQRDINPDSRGADFFQSIARQNDSPESEVKHTLEIGAEYAVVVFRNRSSLSLGVSRATHEINHSGFRPEGSKCTRTSPTSLRCGRETFSTSETRSEYGLVITFSKAQKVRYWYDEDEEGSLTYVPPQLRFQGRIGEDSVAFVAAYRFFGFGLSKHRREI